MVFTRNMREGPKLVPGVVKDQIGPLTYLVQVSGGLQWRRHIDHLCDGGTADPDSNIKILPSKNNWTNSILCSPLRMVPLWNQECVCLSGLRAKQNQLPLPEKIFL